jgi:hypothetical protein
MKKHGYLCLLLFVASVAVNGCFVAVQGVSLTRDFMLAYDPLARELTDWILSSGPSPTIHEAAVAIHINYIVFIAAIYSLFGMGNYTALIAAQILLASLSTLVIFRIVARHVGSTKIAFGCAAGTFLFFDAMFYNTAGSPESLYRSLFIFCFFGLAHLHEKKRTGAFLCLAALSFPLLFFIRIDTLILYMPIYLLGLKIALERLSGKPARLLPLAGAILATILAVSLVVKIPFAGEGIAAYDRDYFDRGIVVADLGDAGRIEPADQGKRGDVVYIAHRFLTLFSLRVIEFLNVTPPTWSMAHSTYYALHMVPLYLLALAGAWKACREGNDEILLIALLFVSAVILHGLTRVDAAHRTGFVSLPFLLMLAGYGWDALWSRRRAWAVTGKERLSAGRRNDCPFPEA